MKETTKEIYPTNDWMFKRIYGRRGKEKITEKFIEAFLGLEVKIEEFRNRNIHRKRWSNRCFSTNKRWNTNKFRDAGRQL